MSRKNCHHGVAVVIQRLKDHYVAKEEVACIEELTGRPSTIAYLN
jgi:hypothetical protein